MTWAAAWIKAELDEAHEVGQRRKLPRDKLAPTWPTHR